jgi:hypothetical protein
MEKEAINFDVRKNKIEVEQDEEGELPCGGDTGFTEVKPKGVNKKICYKCKTNKSNYSNRCEYICR